MKIKRWVINLVLVLAIVVLLFMNLNNKNKDKAFMKSMDTANRYIEELRTISNIGFLGSTHTHADFAIYVEGEIIDFSDVEYQVRANSVHVEDNEGDVLHVHATGITMAHFLRSLDMDLTAECLTLEDGTELCNDKEKSLKFYVNGKENNEYGSYIMQDLDKILVSYGDENEKEISQQLQSITDLAKTKADKDMSLEFE